ncbi:MAG: endolytic transglycosylase MltG [Candidatus Sulfotelmatobacter sp.]
MRRIFWLIFIAVLAGGAWFGWAMLTPTSPPAQTFVMLHPGYSTRRIARELRAAGVIRSEQAFLLWHYFHRRPSLKAGEYLFDKTASAKDVHQRLARGDVYFHTVVVPEGFTMFDIARAVEAAGLGPAAEFLRVAQSDTALIGDMSPGAHSLEGYLFPDTYQFSRMQKMPEIAAAMVCQFRVVAKQIGLTPPSGEMEKDPGESANAAHLCGVVAMQFQNWSAPQNQSQTAVERTVTMASIVEKETAVPEERPMVASVYYNRLEKKIALDADPSIIYAELLAGTYSGALHHDDMQFKSPYNTYRSAGLPPGPIANPGRSALEAAMHPAQSDYYYFVADAQGHHRFAKTMEEHDKNVAAYRRAMRGQ